MDKIFDAYVEAGNIPLVQIGFTPEALSDFDGPYQHSWEPADKYATITTGWAAPPNDLKKWGDLSKPGPGIWPSATARTTVSTWPWEVLERARRPLLDRHDPAILRDVRRQRARP